MTEHSFLLGYWPITRWICLCRVMLLLLPLIRLLLSLQGIVLVGCRFIPQAYALRDRCVSRCDLITIIASLFHAFPVHSFEIRNTSQSCSGRSHSDGQADLWTHLCFVPLTQGVPNLQTAPLFVSDTQFPCNAVSLAVDMIESKRKATSKTRSHALWQRTM